MRYLIIMLLLCTPAMAQEVKVIDNKTIEVSQSPVTQYLENVKANMEGYQREIERYTILRNNMQSLIDQAALAGAEDAYDSASIAVKGSLPAKKVIIKEEEVVTEEVTKELDNLESIGTGTDTGVSTTPTDTLTVEGTI